VVYHGADPPDESGREAKTESDAPQAESDDTSEESNPDEDSNSDGTSEDEEPGFIQF
jgi:hypothetical protein